MDDDGVGSEQAQRLRRALDVAGIGVGVLWLHYFRLGGEVGEVEIDAYLHHALGMPRWERDLLARAANELIDHGAGGHAPYSWELLHGERKETADGQKKETADGESKETADGAGGADGDGGPDGTAP
ncbi:hypothetical protein [Kocuria kalidii]|uniref:hypothetical protein n=1 Tax=Kocuria kalidii TaxID=3376283 RepID=UPI0037924422